MREKLEFGKKRLQATQIDLSDKEACAKAKKRAQKQFGARKWALMRHKLQAGSGTRPSLLGFGKI